VCKSEEETLQFSSERRVRKHDFHIVSFTLIYITILCNATRTFPMCTELF